MIMVYGDLEACISSTQVCPLEYASAGVRTINCAIQE